MVLHQTNAPIMGGYSSSIDPEFAFQARYHLFTVVAQAVNDRNHPPFDALFCYAAPVANGAGDYNFLLRIGVPPERSRTECSGFVEFDKLAVRAVEPALFQIPLAGVDLHAGRISQHVGRHTLAVNVARGLVMGPKFATGPRIHDADRIGLLPGLDPVKYLEPRIARLDVGDIDNVRMSHLERPQDLAVIVDYRRPHDQLIPAVCIDVGGGQTVAALAAVPFFLLR